MPKELYDRFIECLKDFNFIGAQRLKVGIRRGELARWQKAGILVKKVLHLEIPGREPAKLLEFQFWVLCLPYTSTLGLQKNAEPLSLAFLDEKFG